MDNTLKALRYVKKPDTKGHTLYDSVYVKHPEQANPRRQKAGVAGTLHNNKNTGSSWGDEGVLKLGRRSGCTALWITKMPLTVHFKMVLFYEFYLGWEEEKALLKVHGKTKAGTSLVAQWWRLHCHYRRQGFWSLVREQRPHVPWRQKDQREGKEKKTQTSRYGIRGRQGRLWLTLTNLLSGALRSGHRRLHPDIKFKTGERNLGTTDFWDWLVLCGGGCPTSWEVFSSWLALVPLPQLWQPPISRPH